MASTLSAGNNSYGILLGGVIVTSTALGFLIGTSTLKLPYNINYRPQPERANVAEELEAKLAEVPLVVNLRAQDEWTESRAYVSMPLDQRKHLMTAGALSGVGKMAVPPLVFLNRGTKEAVVVLHVGQELCGHKGIVHGGFIATILDEYLGRTALMTFPAQTGVTATLTVNYRRPTMANQFVAIKSQVIEGTERKAKVHGKLETLDAEPLLLCEADGFFVVPSKLKLDMLRDG